MTDTLNAGRVSDRLHRLVRLPVPYIKWRKTAEENEALKRKLVLTQFQARKAIGLLNVMVNCGEGHTTETERVVQSALDFCKPNAPSVPEKIREQL